MSTLAGSGNESDHAGRQIFEIDFDFVEHRLVLRTADRAEHGFALEPMTVACVLPAHHGSAGGRTASS
jgi:hypothetical protein